MGLLFCDGFDHYDTTHLFEKWDTSQGAGSSYSIIASGRNTTSTYNNCLSLGNAVLIGKNISNTSTLIVGAAINPNVLGSYTAPLYTFMDNSQVQITIVLTTSGQLQVVDGHSNILGTTSSPQLSSNTYTYVEVKTVFSTTATGSVTIQVNGSSVLTITGVVTAISANSYANSVLLGGYPNNVYYDDVYMCDATGTYNTTFLGDVRVALALPNATDRLSQWTRTGGTSSGNYTAVDEVPPNDDTSYVSSSTVGQIDAYGISSIGSPTAIVAVQLVASARKTDSASRSIGLGFGNTTTDNFDTGHSVTNSYVMYRRPMDSNPITSAAWAATDLASAQIALKVIS